jgi:predicted transcriptional regulator
MNETRTIYTVTETQTSTTPVTVTTVVSSVAYTPIAVVKSSAVYTVENDTQRAALDLFDLGFNVAPTKTGEKIPFLWRVLVGTRISRDYILPLFSNGAGIFVLTGRLSMNLAILDCDTRAAAAQHEQEFKRRGLSPWIVNTARGAHFWVLSADGELNNTSGDGWQFFGSMHYCLCPPAVHPTGAIYEWAAREGDLPPLVSIADLDWLSLKTRATKRREFDPNLTSSDPLACLSRTTRNFITGGAASGERNTRLFSAACDLHGNEFHMNDAIDLLTPTAQSSGLSNSEIVETIQKAYRKSRTPAKPKKENSSPLPTWGRAVSWARAYKWEAIKITAMNERGKTVTMSVTGATARDVFLALCERSRRDSSDVFRASRREVAELANLTRMTVDRAIACLSSAGFIQPRGYTPNKAALFCFGSKVLRQYASNTTGSDISVPFCNTRSDARADVFRSGALGKTAELIWKAILPPNAPATKAEIARRVGCDRATVTRVLSADGLPKWGLASEVRPRLWIGNAADDRYFAEVAIKSGTAGKAAARRERNKTDRAVYASKLILNTKIKWERVHLGHAAAEASNEL